MADDLVAALAERRDHLRAIVVELGVDQQRIRQVVGLGELEQAPGADAVAVVAPGEAALVRLRVRRGVVVAEALAESEVLDVEAQVHREALAARPAVVLALRSPPFRGGRWFFFVSGPIQKKFCFLSAVLNSPH